MSRQGRWSILVAMAILGGCGGQTSSGPEQKEWQLPDPKAMFAWNTEQKVLGFSHTAVLSPTEVFSRGGTVSALPDAGADLKARALALRYQYATDGASLGVDDYMRRSKAAGLLVIKNGQVVLEKYAYGIGRETLWDSKSLAKSVVSTLAGIALHDGHISSLDNPVTQYVPELAGSAYQDVTLRQMLQMSSGVGWNENYLDPASDIAALLRCYASGDGSNCLLQLLKTRPRVAAPGALFNYSSGEAHLVGLVVQRATGQSLAQYLQRKLWQPYGMEADGRWLTSGGVSFGGSGFNATLRDYGRFGLFMLNDGALPNGARALPEHWVRDATTWQANSAYPGFADNGQYGYMWWFVPAYDNGMKAGPLFLPYGAPAQNTNMPGGAVPLQGRAAVAGQPGSVSDWTFSAQGIYGQMVAINQRENIVVVQLSVWDKPAPTFYDPQDPSYDAADPYNEQAVFLNALIAALH